MGCEMDEDRQSMHKLETRREMGGECGYSQGRCESMNARTD